MFKHIRYIKKSCFMRKIIWIESGAHQLELNYKKSCIYFVDNILDYFKFLVFYVS